MDGGCTGIVVKTEENNESHDENHDTFASLEYRDSAQPFVVVGRIQECSENLRVRILQLSSDTKKPRLASRL